MVVFFQKFKFEFEKLATKWRGQLCIVEMSLLYYIVRTKISRRYIPYIATIIVLAITYNEDFLTYNEDLLFVVVKQFE